MFVETDNLHELDSIQFGILSAEDITRQSVCEVSHLKMFGNQSVYDERMGTLEPGKLCATCGLDCKMCVGHFGHIRLNTYIMHPLFHKLVLSYLKCVCYRCSRILLTKEQLELNHLLKTQRRTRFTKILEKMDRIEFCAHCDTVQPRYIFSSQDRFIYMVFRVDGENSRLQMQENEIYTIFSKMICEDIRLLGFDPKTFHPRNLILTVLPVLPPVARPYVVADGATCDDDLTVQYLEIVKANHHIAESQGNDSRRQKYIHTLKFKIKSLFDNSGDRQRVSNGRPLKGIKKRLTGKEGIIRNNLMGKRVDKSARTVIGPDPTLKVDEIAIPHDIAEILSYPVMVNRYNLEEMKACVREGRANFLLRDRGRVRINLRYATTRQGTKLFFGDVIQKRNGRIRTVRTEKDLFSLEPGDLVYRNGEPLPVVPNSTRDVDIRIGDVIERKLIDGDILLLNRQPTLHKGSMIAQKIRILPGKTIRLNLAVTASFNADFDGDEMNLHCPASPETEAELRLLSSLSQNLITNQSSKANIIIVQDTLLGIYLMTKKNPLFVFSRDDFYQTAVVLEDLTRMESKLSRYRSRLGLPETWYDGRMLFSLLLPDDFWYRDKNDADPLEPEVIIEEGLLLYGAIKKTNLGSSHKSFITLFFHEYGEQRCMRFINEVQFLANRYLLLVGFTVGISDCLVSKKNEIASCVSRSFLKAKSIEEHTHDERIREIYISYALSGARDTGMSIAKNALSESNHFVSTVVSGAKGDYFNIAQITGLLGQQNLNGRRIQPVLSGNKRTLPHYPLEESQYTDDMRYESKGFIRSSFVHGLSPREFFFHAMTGREGITDTAMKSVVWDTTLFLFIDGKPVYTEIGRWIDQLLSESPPDRIQYFQEKGMELMEHLENIYIPTTDEKGNVFWGRVVAVTRHDPGSVLYKIVTRSGRTTTVVESKSLIVWDEITQTLMEKNMTDVRIGDQLPVTLRLPNMTSPMQFINDKKDGIVLGQFLAASITESIPIYAFVAGEEFVCGLVKGYFFSVYEEKKENTVLRKNTGSKTNMEGFSMLCSRVGLFSQLTPEEYTITISVKEYRQKILGLDSSSSEWIHVNDVVLDEIIEILPLDTGSHPKVYDLTIPSTLNFGLANGLHVRDTATSGYIQRRMIKIAEDIQVKYDGTVRNSVNHIVQFAYGENFLSPVHVVFKGDQAVPCDVDRMIQRLNSRIKNLDG